MRRLNWFWRLSRMLLVCLVAGLCFVPDKPLGVIVDALAEWVDDALAGGE